MGIQETLATLRHAFDDQGQAISNYMIFKLGGEEFHNEDVTIICTQVGHDSVALQGVVTVSDHNNDLYYALHKNGAQKRAIRNAVSLYTPPYQGPTEDCITIVLSDIRSLIALVEHTKASL